MGRDKDKKQEGEIPSKTKKSPKKHPGMPKLSPPSLGKTPSTESDSPLDSSTPSPLHFDPSGLPNSSEMQLVVINGTLYQQKINDKGKVELIPLPKVVVAASNVSARQTLIQELDQSIFSSSTTQNHCLEKDALVPIPDEKSFVADKALQQSIKRAINGLSKNLTKIEKLDALYQVWKTNGWPNNELAVTLT